MYLDIFAQKIIQITKLANPANAPITGIIPHNVNIGIVIPNPFPKSPSAGIPLDWNSLETDSEILGYKI